MAFTYFFRDHSSWNTSPNLYEEWWQIPAKNPEGINTQMAMQLESVLKKGYIIFIASDEFKSLSVLCGYEILKDTRERNFYCISF